MLLEKPVSFAAAGISLAIMVPQLSALLEQSSQVPGPALAAGAVISAIAIYLGGSVASTHSKKLGRTLRLSTWGILGLGMSVSTVYFGLRAPEWWTKLLFLAAGCLPLFAHVAVLFKGWQKLR
jgi:hypothetical protein